MVSYAGTKDMLLGWSMASLMVDAGRFIPCMFRSRSMVSYAGTTGIPLGWGVAPRYMGAGRFIPNMSRVGGMPPCKGEAAMLDSVIRECKPEGTREYPDPLQPDDAASCT